MSVPLIGVLTVSAGLAVALTTGFIPTGGMSQEIFFGGIASCASALIMMLSSIEA